MKVMPAASAVSRILKASSLLKGSPHRVPSCQVPKPISLTERPVLPNMRCFILFVLFWFALTHKARYNSIMN